MQRQFKADGRSHAGASQSCALRFCARVAWRPSPGQTGIAVCSSSGTYLSNSRVEHFTINIDVADCTDSALERLYIFAALTRTQGRTGAILQRHALRSRALTTCTPTRSRRRARFVLLKAMYVPCVRDPGHFCRKHEHEQLQNHSCSTACYQAAVRLQATLRRQKQQTLPISQPVVCHLIWRRRHGVKQSALSTHVRPRADWFEFSVRVSPAPRSTHSTSLMLTVTSDAPCSYCIRHIKVPCQFAPG